MLYPTLIYDTCRRERENIVFTLCFLRVESMVFWLKTAKPTKLNKWSNSTIDLFSGDWCFAAFIMIHRSILSMLTYFPLAIHILIERSRSYNMTDLLDKILMKLQCEQRSLELQRKVPLPKISIKLWCREQVEPVNKPQTRNWWNDLFSATSYRLSGLR